MWPLLIFDFYMYLQYDIFLASGRQGECRLFCPSEPKPVSAMYQSRETFGAIQEMVQVERLVAKCSYSHFLALNQVRSAAGIRKNRPQRIGYDHLQCNSGMCSKFIP